MAGRPKFDLEEARALRAQGWLLQSIADKFEVTRASVSLRLSRERSRSNRAVDRRACSCGCGQTLLSRGGPVWAATGGHAEWDDGVEHLVFQNRTVLTRWRRGEPVQPVWPAHLFDVLRPPPDPDPDPGPPYEREGPRSR